MRHVAGAAVWRHEWHAEARPTCHLCSFSDRLLDREVELRGSLLFYEDGVARVTEEARGLLLAGLAYPLDRAGQLLRSPWFQEYGGNPPGGGALRVEILM
jgi:hypothetical protein